jgi:putative addiction module component (TIGR02574 family)
MSTEELLAQVLRLSREDRTRVAGEVLSSLEESEDAAAEAWATELERRARQVASGQVQPIPWETARTQLLSELAARRARKAAS